jgi:hypothetical protein
MRRMICSSNPDVNNSSHFQPCVCVDDENAYSQWQPVTRCVQLKERLGQSFDEANACGTSRLVYIRESTSALDTLQHRLDTPGVQGSTVRKSVGSIRAWRPWWRPVSDTATRERSVGT